MADPTPDLSAVASRVQAWYAHKMGLTVRVTSGNPPTFHYAMTDRELNDVRLLLSALSRLESERDAAKATERARIVEAVRGMKRERDIDDDDHDVMCAVLGGGTCDSCISVDAHNAAIDAVLAALEER